MSAARNIEKMAKEHGLSVESVSSRSFKIPFWSYLANMTYRRNYLKNIASMQAANHFQQPSFDLAIIESQYRLYKLQRFIVAKKPKVILLTFRSDLGSLYILRQRGLIPDIPIGYVETDYRESVDSFLYPSFATMTFVPSKDWIEESIRRGVPKAKLTLSGIPVDPRLKSKGKWSDFDKWKKMLRISKHDFCVGLNGGTLGAGDFPAMIESVLSELEGSRVRLIVATGTNREMYQRLKRMYPPAPNSKVILIPFHQDLAMVMKCFADVYVTKPGGLSLTEAAVMKKPLVIVNRGQGQYNIDYFSKYKMAVLSTPSELGAKIVELKENLKLRSEIVSNQSEINALPGTHAVVEWLSKMKQQPSVNWDKPVSFVREIKEACELFVKAPVRKAKKILLR